MLDTTQTRELSKDTVKLFSENLTVVAFAVFHLLSIYDPRDSKQLPQKNAIPI